MIVHNKRKPLCKVWLEYKGKPLIGKGGSQILQSIQKERSLSRAAEKLEMSYRYVWSYLAKIEKALGEPVVKTRKGGKGGGGSTELTELGENLLKEYQRVERYVGELLGDEEYWEAVGLKITARNRLKGIVQDVKKGEVAAKVRVKVTKPIFVTALISREAVEELDIKKGDHVEAVIKATEVMIAKRKKSVLTQ